MTNPAALASRELIVVTGKGGVGKTALSAALGLLLSDLGRRTLLLEVGPRETLHHWLGADPSGGEIATVRRGLHLRHLTPRREMDALVREHLRVGPLVRRVLASPVYAHFVDGAPGLKELAVLGHALRLVAGPRIRGAPQVDSVVLDAPATGHGVSLLAAPSLARSVVPHGPFGRLAGRLAALVGDASRCAIVVVTLAEEMPSHEALALQGSLRRQLGRSADLLVVNGLYPEVPEGGAAACLRDPALRHWPTRRAVNERELATLRERWDGDRIELPLLPLDRGPQLAAALRDLLAQVGGGSLR